MNTVSKSMFKENLKIDAPLASNLSKTATSFLHPYAKLKNSFSLLLKLILKKFNPWIILQVESDRFICVSLNSIKSLFSIL